MTDYSPDTEHPTIRPLTSRATEPLAWQNDGFYYTGLTRIRTIPDASALLHAVLNGFWVPYRSCQLNNIIIGRAEMVETWRGQLAERLDEHIDPSNALSPSVYDCLARGKMHEFCEIIKEFHIDVMRSELCDPNFFLDDKYLELIANELSHDIYILNGLTRDVHVFDHSDVDMYYKHRPTVVILFLPSHFELVGLQTPDGDVMTNFSPDSGFVQALRARYLKLLNDSA